MDDTHYTTLPNAADALALQAQIPDLVADCPDMYAMAYQIAKDILVSHHITDIEPDKVYWHRFHAAQSSARTFTGWQHVVEKPKESMTFPQLVMQRFDVHDQDNADLLDLYGGFYRVGADAENYDETNEVRLHSNEVLKAFWAINFSDRYKTAIATFWEKHDASFRALAKCTFIAKAIEDYENGHLCREHFTTVLRAVAGNVSRPLTRQMLMDPSFAAQGLSVHQFRVGDFVATDILGITDGSGLNILYLPGESRGFHSFTTAAQLHEWLGNEVDDANGRERLLMHFQQEDRDILQDRPTTTLSKLSWLTGVGALIHVFDQPHIDNIGLNHEFDVLTATAPGAHQHQGKQILGDAFSYLKDATHARMISDANFVLHSNGEIRKKLWIGYLNAFSHTFGPLAALAWPAALMVVGAGMANVGLHIDRAINGTTPAERKAAITGAILSSVDVLFNLPFLRGASELAEALDVEESLSLEEDPRTEIEKGTAPRTPTDLIPTNPSEAEVLAPFETNEIVDGVSPVSDEGRFRGIYQPETGGNYIAIDDRFYLVRYLNELKTWAIIDPINPHSFYRNLPVRMDELGQWVPITRAGLYGGGKLSSLFTRGPAEVALPDFDAPATAYDVPPALKSALKPAAEGNLSKWDLKDGFVNINNPNNEFEAFKKLRRTLYNDAEIFYSNLQIPTRPSIPTFIPSAKTKDIIKTLLNRSSALVVGESHSSVGSKQFLIEHMQVLSKQKVKTLYMEHLLTDFHQVDLDVFNRTAEMPEGLERYLQNLDAGFHTDPSGQFTFEQVIRTAQKNNIRVQAIDCMASYRSSGIEGADETFRQKMMNYFAKTVIGADQAARGAHKWVALVGNSHANTFEGAAGLSELEGGIGLRIDSVGLDEPASIKADPGVAYEARPGQSAGFVKNDLLLQIKTPKSVIQAQALEDGLPSAGMFTLTDGIDHTVIVHRSSNGLLVRTPILRDGHRFYIERPSWPSISARRYETPADLSTALRRTGMTLVRLPHA